MDDGNPVAEEEEHSEGENQLTEEYDSLFDDVSLEDDDVMLSEDDVILEVIQEVSEEESDLPEDQPLLALIQDEVVEDPHKLAIDQIDLALAHLSNNVERLKILESQIDSLETDSDSSEDCNYEVDQTTVNELKAMVARLEDELHSIQVQQLQLEINALNVSAAVTDQRLSENREQLSLKEKVLEDSSTLICSLTNALDTARNETKSIQTSLAIFKRRCHKAERKSLADRKKVSSAAARHEASLIEQVSLQARVEELEAHIDNLEAPQEETKALEVREEVLEQNINEPNTEMSVSTKTTANVTPNESKLISQLALMKRGYNQMLDYIMILEVEYAKLSKQIETNESLLTKVSELEKEKADTLDELHKKETEVCEIQYKLDSLEGALEIPMTPYIQANLAAAAAMEKSQQDFYPGEPMPIFPHAYGQPAVQSAPPSPKFALPSSSKFALPPSPKFALPPSPKFGLPHTSKFASPSTASVPTFIIHLGSNDKDSLDSDSSSEDAPNDAQGSTEQVKEPNNQLQGEAKISNEKLQHSLQTLAKQIQYLGESSTNQAKGDGESSTKQTTAESSTEQTQGNVTDAQQADIPPLFPNQPIPTYQPYYAVPPFDPFCTYRPGSHSFMYKEVRDNRRCRWCWCALIPRNTVQCQVCNILVHNTCKKVVPFTCGYPDPIWNHYISLPVSHTEIPATQSYTLPNPCCWVIFHRERSARRYVMLYGPNINIYGHVPGPYDMPLEIIPLQMCGLMPRLTVDLTNRFRLPNIDKCIAYQQMVTPNPNRRPGTTFILEFGNHWDRECFIDAISLFIATLTPPGPYDHFQNK